jgi:hypothetical protein
VILSTPRSAMADEPGKPVMIGTDVVGQLFASPADSDASP